MFFTSYPQAVPSAIAPSILEELKLSCNLRFNEAGIAIVKRFAELISRIWFEFLQTGNTDIAGSVG